jgi:2-polyprenyl-3-methyl-5-hydroxy-6-metoxy-1,4-benzoquinol methylase
VSHDVQFTQENGILIPARRPQHRQDEYDEEAFDTLLAMQRRHFWYQGRHELILRVLQQEIPRHFGGRKDLAAIDMGGGCGGWVEYLRVHGPARFQTLALADSSIRALTLAGAVVGSSAPRYQIDLLDLPWSADWDLIFLLDVLEHIPDHEQALREIAKCLRPGGLLLVATPALNCFWTYNDDIAQHQRRYCRQDFQALAGSCGLELLRTDYFMFLLSPVLLLSRWLLRPPQAATPEQLRQHLARTHRIPSQPINWCFSRLLSLEASLVNAIRFPWGTSILAVFRRPL